MSRQKDFSKKKEITWRWRLEVDRPVQVKILIEGDETVIAHWRPHQVNRVDCVARFHFLLLFSNVHFKFLDSRIQFAFQIIIKNDNECMYAYIYVDYEVT